MKVIPEKKAPKGTRTPKPMTPERLAAREKRRKQKKIKRIVWRVSLCVLTFIVFVVGALLAAGAAAFRGGSKTVSDLLTVTMLETSALKFVPRIYFSEDEVAAIVARNEVQASGEETDTSLIVIATPTPMPTKSPEDLIQPTATPNPADPDGDGIEIYEVHGNTYNGIMMVVLDPSRVSVGTCRDNFNGNAGLRLNEIAARYGAVAAINGGAFEDDGGMGNGGMPAGLVVSNGKLLHGANYDSSYNISVGFTYDNVLVVGKTSNSKVESYGIRDALTFGPALIINGNAESIRGASSGLNPRTAIGQRADGAVLMLVVDGRSASSLGATYADLIEVMLEYGAVNACNLDGGSSSQIYYNGQYLNNGVVLTGSRKMPTAFIVR